MEEAQSLVAENVEVTAFDWQAGAPDSDKEQSGGEKGRKWIVRAGDYAGALSKQRHDAVAISGTLKGQRGKGGGGIGPEETLVAATLSQGSNPNSNMAGRRREDDVNLVASPLEASDGHHGYSSPRGDGADNLIVPISGDALRGEGSAKTPSEDAAGQVRLRDPGLGIGEGGDPAYTLSKTEPGALAAAAAVRRLTPVECERLQGFPDGWTDPTGEEPDSRRYAALGDAVTVNVACWIGLRLAAAEA